MLRIKNVTKKFDDGFVAVKDLSFEVNSGEIVGLLGPNGAGKTTTIQMILGTLTPTAGDIVIFGKNIRTHLSEVLQDITFASAYVRFPGRLTVQENLDVIGRLYSMSAEQRQRGIQKVLEHFGMWDYRDRYANELSAGQITRIMLAKAFLPCPKLIILDEPTASLDPDVAYEVRHFILDRRKQHGTTVLITSHNMAEVSEMCDRVLVVKNGELIANATPHELARSVSAVRVHVVLCKSDREKFIVYAQRMQLHPIVDNYCAIVELDEQKIAQIFIDLAHEHIMYEQVSIEKPTLEDYFLKLVSV